MFTTKKSAKPTSPEISIFAGDQQVKGKEAKENYLDHPKALARDRHGNIYVTTSNRIRKVSVDGRVTTFAGPHLMNNYKGYVDGKGDVVRFDDPAGIAVGPDGNLYVADKKNDRIRKIDTDGNVTTLAGSGKQGDTDGDPKKASFDRPTGVAIDSHGNIYVADMHNCRIRCISSSGKVTTIAGSKEGFKNGKASTAQFFLPVDVAIDPTTNDIIVADQYNHQIRRISCFGEDCQVSTVAGLTTSGFQDGSRSEALFNSPSGVDLDSNGVIYVSDTGNNAIRKIDREGTVTTIAYKTNSVFSGKPAFNSPLGILLTNDKHMIVADWQSNLLKIFKLET